MLRCVALFALLAVAKAGLMCVRCNQARETEEKCNNQKGSPGTVMCDETKQVCTTDVRCDGKGRPYYIKGCQRKRGITALDTLICNDTPGSATRCHRHCDSSMCNLDAPEVAAGLICTPNERCGPVDVILILDASQTIDMEDYYMARTFLADVISGLPDSVHVGIIHFATSSTIDHSLEFGADPKADIADIAGNLNYDAGVTRTHLAINDMVDQFLDFGRDGVPKVGLVFTDGRSNDHEATAIAIKDARDAVDGLTMLAVAAEKAFTESEANRDELKLIATGPGYNNVIMVDDYVDLQGVVTDAIQLICDPDEADPSDCGEVLFIGGLPSWQDQYGSYEITEDECVGSPGSPVYRHVSGNFFLFHAVEFNLWGVSSISCGGQALAALSSTDPVVPESDADAWLEYADGLYEDLGGWTMCF